MSIDLDAIRQRANNATRGPWSVGIRWFDGMYHLPITSPSTDEDNPHQPDHIAVIRYDAGGFQYPHADARADAEFIAAARSDVVDLLAEVDRLRADNTRLRNLARCCGEDSGHDGPCIWDCSMCGGDGRCPDCDARRIDPCDTCNAGECPAGCDDGRVVDSHEGRPVETARVGGGVL